MQPSERIAAAIRAANDSERPGLVPFITAGYPEPGEFAATLKQVASEGDVVELGIPFSDPMADGMTIQRSSFEALKKGVSLAWIFEQLDAVAGVVGEDIDEAEADDAPDDILEDALEDIPEDGPEEDADEAMDDLDWGAAEDDERRAEADVESSQQSPLSLSADDR